MPHSPDRPVWWKVIVGSLLLFIEIDNHVHPAPNLIKAETPGEQAGMYMAMAGLIALGCWLLYSGTKPMWRKTR
jgi:hypothetical protein